MSSEIMFIAHMGPGDRPEWARIGWVRKSKTGRTLFYDGRELRGTGQPWYRDIETGEPFVIQHARKDGLDRSEGRKRGSFVVEIDDDAREDYWITVRGEPDRVRERTIRS